MTTPSIGGCDKNAATVSGTVTLDGQPIAVGPRIHGMVSFVRDSGGGAPAMGELDSSGNYSLRTGSKDVVEPGLYRVSIAVNKTTIPADPNAMPIPTLLTPKKYGNPQSSGFQAEVKPGDNVFDFELVSDGGS